MESPHLLRLWISLSGFRSTHPDMQLSHHSLVLLSPLRRGLPVVVEELPDEWVVCPVRSHLLDSGMYY